MLPTGYENWDCSWISMMYMVNCTGEWFDQVTKVFNGDISVLNVQKEIQLGHPQLPILEGCWIILGWAWASSRMHLGCPCTDMSAAIISSSRTTWLHWHGLSFTVKPWASRGIHAMYERSYQMHPWSQGTSCCLSLVASACHAIVRLTILQKVSCRACC